LLCNVYLHRIDRASNSGEHGTIVRFADDLLVMCRTRRQAEAALARLGVPPAELGLEPKEAKTAIIHLKVGGPRLEFLGFHHRMARGLHRGKGVLFLASRLTDKAMAHARERVRQLTVRSRLWLSAEAIVQDINEFLRGWVGHFRYGHSADRFAKIREYTIQRLAIFIAKRHKRGRRFGLNVVAYKSPDQYGLTKTTGIVVAPRANKPWQEKPNTGGERRRRAGCGRTARPVRRGGSRKRDDLTTGTIKSTADRETGGIKALDPTVKRDHHLACSRPDSAKLDCCFWDECLSTDSRQA
jgi:RNA-directed DNA polymerase